MRKPVIRSEIRGNRLVIYIPLSKIKSGRRPILPSDLSPRQEIVYRAMLRNLSYKEIAAELGISVRTVKFHTQNVLAKKKCRSRVELVLQAARRDSVGKIFENLKI